MSMRYRFQVLDFTQSAESVGRTGVCLCSALYTTPNSTSLMERETPMKGKVQAGGKKEKGKSAIRPDEELFWKR